MMSITYNVYEAYHNKTNWLDCSIVNDKIEKGWDKERLFSWLIQQINYEDGYDFTYDEALELKELVIASNNYRL